MKRISNCSRALALTALLAPWLSAQAQNHEVGVGLSGGGTGILVDASYGYKFNKNFRLEGEAATGTFVLGDVDYFISGFAVARFPFGEKDSALFARAGAGPIKYSSSLFCGGIFACNSNTEMLGQIGFGVEHFFSQNWGVKFDATAVINPGALDNGEDDDEFTDYVSISLVRRF
ncbi:MAG: hypothetical protein RJS97_02210 [Parvibaculaceae bacterium]